MSVVKVDTTKFIVEAEGAGVYKVTVDVPAPIQVTVQGLVAGGGGSSVEFVFGETPAGLVNGSNATFTSLFPFVPESVVLTVNGVNQKKVQDFNTSGTQTILMNTSPGAGETILTNYIKA